MAQNRGNTGKGYSIIEDLPPKDNLDTLPKLFRHVYQRRPNDVAMRKKEYGIWNEFTWKDCYYSVKYFALGMVSIGLNKGDRICIIGDNDPEWFWAEMAAQSVGAIPVGIYIDSLPEEIEYIALDSESIFAIAKDQEQVDKFLEIIDKLPNMRKIIYWENSGMWDYEGNPWLMEFKFIMELGEKYAKENPDFVEMCIDKGNIDDVALFSYTSGTTGLPKGVMVGHDLLIWGASQMSTNSNIKKGDEYVSFGSPAWIGEQLLGISEWVIDGIIVNFPEEPDTVIEDLREIGSAYFVLGPKQWEDLLSKVQFEISNSTRLRQLVYRVCLPIGYKVADYQLNKKTIPLQWKFLYWIATLICFRPIRDYLGLRKLKLGLTGGALLGPDTFKLFRAIGVNLSEIYGLSEATPISMHGEDVNIGTVGHLCDGVEAKISEEGELLVKTPAMFKEYYKDPESTAEKMVDGWLHTGDACIIRDDGDLVYMDRLKDLLILKGGGKYSATYLENRLTFSQYIKTAMIIGNETKEFLVALIAIDFNNVGKWAERNRIPYTTFIDLSQKKEVYELIYPEIVRVNKTLSINAKIEKFINLPKEFDPDEGELTRTRKLKREILWHKYGDLIDAAYRGDDKVLREVEVKYRDGRSGKVKCTLKIQDLNRD